MAERACGRGHLLDTCPSEVDIEKKEEYSKADYRRLNRA